MAWNRQSKNQNRVIELQWRLKTKQFAEFGGEKEEEDSREFRCKSCPSLTEAMLESLWEVHAGEAKLMAAKN